MTYYQRQIRISRRRALRRILSRRGLLLTVRIETDSDFIATVDDRTPPRGLPAEWPDQTHETAPQPEG